MTTVDGYDIATPVPPSHAGTLAFTKTVGVQIASILI